MPRTAAASASSRVRTLPRSPSGTSDGSLIDPRSPRDAHINTTRTPASVSRASVPPHSSDSSSGCAKTASTVLLPLFVTVRSGQPAVDGDVFVDHARRAEPRDGALAHAPAVEIEHARKSVDQFLEVVEHFAGHAFIDDFAHRALVER